MLKAGGYCDRADGVCSTGTMNKTGGNSHDTPGKGVIESCCDSMISGAPGYNYNMGIMKGVTECYPGTMTTSF